MAWVRGPRVDDRRPRRVSPALAIETHDPRRGYEVAFVLPAIDSPQWVTHTLRDAAQGIARSFADE